MSQLPKNCFKASKKLGSLIRNQIQQHNQKLPLISGFQRQCSIRRQSTSSNQEITVSEGSYGGSLIVNDEAKTKEKDGYKTLIWMHGLGDSPHGFAEIFQQLTRM